MKKLLLLIITIAYFVSSSGATIYFHECMGKVVHWDFEEDTKDKCANCGMHKNAPNDCCKDEVKVLKIDGEQRVSKAWNQSFLLTNVLVPITYFSLIPPTEFLIQKKSPSPNIFNRSCKANYCILFCTFLI